MNTSTTIRISKTADGLNVVMDFDTPNPDLKLAETIEGVLGLVGVLAIKNALENAEKAETESVKSLPGNN